jgi:hypothetical protein
LKDDAFQLEVSGELASWLYAEAMARGMTVEALIAALIAEAKAKGKDKAAKG